MHDAMQDLNQGNSMASIFRTVLRGARCTMPRGVLMSSLNEVRIYERALNDAREHLRHWERLGQLLGKTDDPEWQVMLALRQADLEELESQARRVKNRR